MEIIQTIKIPIKREGKYIICHDTRVLGMLLGTKAAASNLYIYKVEKVGPTKWKVPIETIENRITELKKRINKDMDYLEIMQQVISNVRKRRRDS